MFLRSAPRRLGLMAAATTAAFMAVTLPANASVPPHRPTRVAPPSWITQPVPGAPSTTTTPAATLTSSQLAAGHPAVVNDKGTLALRIGNIEQPYFFTGINAYQLTSLWGVNNGCGWGGWSPALLDSFFSTLPANAMVRTWLFQADATQVVNGVSQRNWAGTDEVINEADKYNVHLVLTLGNQDGTCDDNDWKTADWYAGGYKSVPAQTGAPAGPGLTSYAQWVHDAVSRYAGSPSVAMWEPINEPQAASCSSYPGWDCWGQTTCPDEQAANNALLSFYTTVGQEIHALDPGKLVSDGSFGNSNCGSTWTADFDRLITSPGIDVVTYHDYSGVIENWDLAPRTAAAAALGKPTMVGEAGVTGCGSAATQAQQFSEKMAAAKKDGVSAYLPWWYGGDGGNPTCDTPIDTDSPTWSTIMGASGPMGMATSG